MWENGKDDRAFQVAESADFTELTKGYTRTYHKHDRFRMRVGKKKTEFVRMDQPRSCFYIKEHYNGNADEWETETVTLKAPPPYTNSSIPPVEYMGITLRQLRAVEANIERRCVAEKWTDSNGNLLTPDKVSLYDTNKYVIRPFTEEKQQSFVSCLPSTAGPQPPRFFISHWWGQPVTDFIRCIEQFVSDFSENDDEHDKDDRRGGGMTSDTPLWICAFANNQWALGGDNTQDPKDSGFIKAMQVTQGRTITILDKEGVLFSRIWCVYELFLTLIDARQEKEREDTADGLWAVYTAFPHTYDYRYIRRQEKRQAVGIIPGGATSDVGNCIANEARERPFPFELITKSLSIQVEDAVASKEPDRVHILNSIRGSTRAVINDVPPATHDNYTAVNDALRATFTTSIPRLQAASKQNDKVWCEFLTALSKGGKEVTMRFDFSADGWSGLTADRAIQLIVHLPITIVMLGIRSGNFGSKFMEALIQRVSKASKLKCLEIDDTLVGFEEGREEIGVKLAEVMASDNTIEDLWLWNTDLLVSNNAKQWGDALVKNTTLSCLRLSGVEDDIQSDLKTISKNRIPKLDIRAW